MSKIRLNGTTSGYTEIAPPAVAGDNTITLPSSNGSANQILKNSGTAGVLEYGPAFPSSNGSAHQILKNSGTPGVLEYGPAFPSGNGTNGQYLQTDGSGTLSWASVSSGKVLQVVQTVKSDTFSAASTSFVDITGYAATITPSSSSNKVLVIVEAKLSNSSLDSSMLLLLRGSTAIYVGDASGSRVQASGTTNFSKDGIETVMCVFLDSPATTSGVTYKTQIRSNAGTAYLNRSAPDSSSAVYARTASSITLVEIAP